MCVERLFLGQQPKSTRTTQQPEREGKASVEEWKTVLGQGFTMRMVTGSLQPRSWREASGKLGTVMGRESQESSAQSITGG